MVLHQCQKLSIVVDIINLLLSTVTMTVNDEAEEFASTGEFIGLNLNQPLYVAGVPDLLVPDIDGYTRSYSGELVYSHLLLFSSLARLIFVRV